MHSEEKKTHLLYATIHLPMPRVDFQLQCGLLSKFTHPESGFGKGEMRLQLQ